MKTQIWRVMTLGLAVSSLGLCAGCEEDQAAADTLTSPSSDPSSIVAAQPSRVNQPGAAANTTNVASGAAKSLPGGTNAAARAAQKLALPENVKISPALAEVVKLAQAGVSEEVMLTYITNSTNVFQVGADEIVFLNDLGVPAGVITTLIQHDAAPDTLARQQAAGSVKPLPPELALTTPATNVYPSQASPPPITNYQEAATAVPVYVNPPATEVAAEAAPPPTTVNYFYTSLAPYGNWVEVPDYGLCWQPTVAVADSYWRPYADNGRWHWTDCGWYWHSYYSWGWAPFHYGRWHCPSGVGWVWTPDTYWGPAWVTWRYTPYYCGWAPLPPRCHYVNGFGLYYRNSSVSVGFGFGYGCDDYTWIHNSYLCDPYPHHYFVAAGHTRSIYNQSTVINNYVAGHNNAVINHGMGVDRIARVSRSGIRKVAVRDEPVATFRGGRFERFEQDGDSPVLVRPRLPDRPPQIPNVTPTRMASELRKPGPPASKRASLETEKQATALMPSSARNAAAGVAPSAPGARPDTAGLEVPRVSTRMPPRREISASGSGRPSVIVTDGRNDTLNRESPSSPAPQVARENERPRPSAPFKDVASTASARNFDDPPGTIRMGRAPQPTRQQPAVSGVRGSASAAAPASPAMPESPAPSYTAPVTRPSSVPSSVARNDVAISRVTPASRPTPPIQRTEPVPAPVSRPSPPPAPSMSPPPSRPQYIPAPAPSVSVVRSAPAPSAPPAASRPTSPPPRAAAPPSSSPPSSRPSGGRGNN